MQNQQITHGLTTGNYGKSFFSTSSHFLTVMSKDPSSLSVKAKMPTNAQQQPHQPPEIDDIQNINIESVELECNIVRGQLIWIDVHIKKKTCCIVCNKTLPVEQDKEYITCTIKQCNMTTLTSMLKPKFVCQVIVMTENNATSYDTCFNDGINSFPRKIDKDLSITICQQMN